jgi:RNA polymerase sigma-70 factor (ECF subfamily)
MTASVAGVRGRIAVNKAAPVDQRAEALVRANFSFVWRTLRRFGVMEAEADDAAQRVFVVVTQKLDQIEPGRQRAFLFGTAVRIADKVRRANARRPVNDGIEPDAQCALAPSAEELVDQRRARQLLDSILDRLSEDLRVVFVLYEVEQMTMAEIADLLALPPGTVASRLRRARQLFCDRLERQKALSEKNHG